MTSAVNGELSLKCYSYSRQLNGYIRVYKLVNLIQNLNIITVISLLKRESYLMVAFNGRRTSRRQKKSI